VSFSVDWASKVITVPQSYLTFISGTLYELDTDQFRLDLRALESSAVGIVFDDAHSHTTSYTIAGVTYARAISIINDYTITFEDGQYAVKLSGSNNDLFAEGVINRNQVSVIPTNSAGLVVITSATAAADIADAVWDEPLSDHTTSGTAGHIVRAIRGVVSALLGRR